MYLANGAAQLIGDLAAALGARQNRCSLVSPANTARHSQMHQKWKAKLSGLVVSTFVERGKKEKKQMSRKNVAKIRHRKCVCGLC